MATIVWETDLETGTPANLREETWPQEMDF